MTFRSFQKLLAVSSVLVGASALAGELALNCPAGTTQAEMRDGAGKVVFCKKAGAGQGKQFEGPVVALRADGSKMSQGERRQGFRSGTWSYFDEKGVKTAEIQFERGNFHGTHKEFHPNGKVRTEKTFERGQPRGQVKEFDLNGRLVRATDVAQLARGN